MTCIRSCLVVIKDEMWKDHFLTRFLVADVDVESEDDEQSDQSRPPVNDEHHHQAQDRPSKRHPHVVVLEAGAPPCGETGVKRATLTYITKQVEYEMILWSLAEIGFYRPMKIN